MRGGKSWWKKPGTEFHRQVAHRICFCFTELTDILEGLQN